jgi:hypothetical protein
VKVAPVPETTLSLEGCVVISGGAFDGAERCFGAASWVTVTDPAVVVPAAPLAVSWKRKTLLDDVVFRDNLTVTDTCPEEQLFAAGSPFSLPGEEKRQVVALCTTANRRTLPPLAGSA